MKAIEKLSRVLDIFKDEKTLNRRTLNKEDVTILEDLVNNNLIGRQFIPEYCYKLFDTKKIASYYGFKSSSISVCSWCDEKKVRMFNKVRNKQPIYVDETDRQWHGRVCPECYMQKQLTFNRKNPIYLDTVEFHEKRKCPKCQGKLELTRWLSCLKCVPELPSDSGDDHIFECTICRPSELSFL